jgi:hypothetical protein
MPESFPPQLAARVSYYTNSCNRSSQRFPKKDPHMVQAWKSIFSVV